MNGDPIIWSFEVLSNQRQIEPLVYDGPVSPGTAGDRMILSVLPKLLDEIERRGLKAVPLP